MLMFSGLGDAYSDCMIEHPDDATFCQAYTGTTADQAQIEFDQPGGAAASSATPSAFSTAQSCEPSTYWNSVTQSCQSSQSPVSSFFQTNPTNPTTTNKAASAGLFSNLTASPMTLAIIGAIGLGLFLFIRKNSKSTVVP